MKTSLRVGGSATSRVGAGCMILFALPFAAIGIGTAVGGIRKLLAGEGGDGLFLLLFGCVFSAAGFGLIALALYGGRAAVRQNARKAAHPDEPWLWKPAWADGRIRCEGKRTMLFVCAFAGIWNLISTPLLFVIPREVSDKQNYAALIALLFPLIGACLLVWAGRTVLRWRKYGASVFEMASVPGVIGGPLGGIIHTRVHMRPDDGFRLRLTCVNRVTTGSGDNRSTSEHVRWQEERVVMRELLADDPTRSALPVLFTIPYDCAATNQENPNNEIIWRLTAEADVPGVDFHAQFDVPVFRTAESSADVTAADAAADNTGELDQTAPKTPSRIVVTPLAHGVEIYLPPNRNPGASVGIVAFTVIWLCVVAGIIVSDAPLIFPFVFGGFGVLICMAAVWMVLGTTRVRAEFGAVSVRGSVLGVGHTRTVPYASVRRIDAHIGMQSGNTPYYVVRITLDNNKTLTAGGGIRDKREAERLAAVLAQAIEAG